MTWGVAAAGWASPAGVAVVAVDETLAVVAAGLAAAAVTEQRRDLLVMHKRTPRSWNSVRRHMQTAAAAVAEEIPCWHLLGIHQISLLDAIS